jgi:hypothetical protein
MNYVQILFYNGSPVAAFTDEDAAHCAAMSLPGSMDPYLCLIGVPLDVELAPERDGVGVVAAGERRVSGAAGPDSVTLSIYGNKKE